MARGQQHSHKNHRAHKNRRISNTEQQQRWGGLKPIITGPLGEAKHHTLVASLAHRAEKKRVA